MEIKNYYVIPGVPRPSPNPIEILNAVCKEYDINIRQLRTKTRKRERVEARLMAAKLLRESSNITLKHTAAMVGLDDHSSVVFGLNKLRNHIELYDEIRKRYERIKNILQ